MRRKKKREPNEISSLKKKLDMAFSHFIRNRDKWKCYTCGTIAYGKGMHCGHFISRKHMSTRFDELNCHAQCVSCNLYKDGNMAEYSYRLMKEFGQKEFDKLIKRGRGIKQWTAKELISLIEHYNKLNKKNNNAKAIKNLKSTSVLVRGSESESDEWSEEDL